jgi:hypothetical protein
MQINCEKYLSSATLNNRYRFVCANTLDAIPHCYAGTI